MFHVYFILVVSIGVWFILLMLCIVIVLYFYIVCLSQSENRMRRNNRADNALRPIRITRHYTRHAEGSVLIACGDTQVICTASVEAKVPRWLKG